MSKTIKVSIQDQNTLVLQEDANKGDLIDLQSIHEVDIDKSSITSIVKSIKMAEFNAQLAKEKENIERQKQLEAKLKEQEIIKRAQEGITQKEQEIAKLQAQIQLGETQKKLAITEAISKTEKERDQLAYKLEKKDSEAKIQETSLKEKYEDKLKSKDEMIEYYKDLKLKLSTKMLGETLELHCEIEFNKLRATAFPNAYFEKDNDASTGSKGDYVYRESDDQGTEVISIMFEMKNESDETATKKKNEDFLKKLDHDRRDKDCEYAVLVTLLESDSELYNTGIVDMSHKYPKMYVIRPQFFIPMITLLRNSALNSLKYKSELALVRSQNIDITRFEDEVSDWKDSWLKSMKYAGKKHLEAVEQINKAIKDLEKVRDALTLSDKHLLTAENKMDDLTIKRLTANSPSVARAFENKQDN